MTAKRCLAFDLSQAALKGHPTGLTNAIDATDGWRAPWSPSFGVSRRARPSCPSSCGCVAAPTTSLWLRDQDSSTGNFGAAHGHLPHAALDGRLRCGELGLDGTERAVRGGLAIADLAHRQGCREVLLPAANALEATALAPVPVIPLATLKETVDHLLGNAPLQAVIAGNDHQEVAPAAPDLAEVRGQPGAKRALEIAASRGHNLLALWKPAGVTLLARRSLDRSARRGSRPAVRR